MITAIEQRPMGFTFEDWQDVLHDTLLSSEPVVVGNYRRDGLDEDEVHYLDLEAAYCGLRFLPIGGQVEEGFRPPPSFLTLARGVGNWRDPKLVLVCERVNSRCGEGGSPKWMQFRKYLRQRPLGTNDSSRHYIHRLLSTAGLLPRDVYVTAARKDWLPEDQSGPALAGEMRFIKCPKVIAIGKAAADEYQRWVHQEPRILYPPPSYWEGLKNWGAHWQIFKEMLDEQMA